MAKALLIDRNDLIELTVLDGVVDSDKFLQNIAFAQDFKLEPIIGQDLLDKLEEEITNDTLADPYLTLLDKYIRPFLAQSSASDYMQTAALRVDNGGVSTYQPDLQIVSKLYVGEFTVSANSVSLRTPLTNVFSSFVDVV